MNTQDKDQIAAASGQIAANTDIRTVTLDHPLKRGESEIKTVTLRRPFGPALRGLSLAKLVNEADHDAFAVLIPRISEPMISKTEIESGALVASDLLQIIGEITDFFIPKWARTEAQDGQSPTE